jgi:signal peptidase I
VTTGVHEPEGQTASGPGGPGQTGGEATPPRRRRRRWRIYRDHVGPWVELLLVVVLAFLAAYLVQWLVVKPYKIPSESMENTLDIGDRVLVARFWYRIADVHRGDIVVFHPPGDDETNFIKRVVGLPGEWVGGRAGKVWVCSTAVARRAVMPLPGCRQLDEPYVSSRQRFFTFRKVSPGSYFMMGDNRDNSDDSREIGEVAGSRILGRAFVTYWPPQRIGLFP